MSGPDRGVPPEEVRAAEKPTGDVDVLAVHRQALREPQDPGEGAERGPWWFWAASVIALVLGGFYFGRYAGPFGGAETVHARPGIAPAAAAPAAPAEVSGEAVYSGNCAACHQTTGAGLAGAFPPLAGSDWVAGDEATLVRLVLHGLQGPVTVAGQTYNGLMPAWKDLLNDAQVAAVLTYVRSSFGNSAGPVAAELVAEQRAATSDRVAAYTVAELR